MIALALDVARKIPIGPELLKSGAAFAPGRTIDEFGSVLDDGLGAARPFAVLAELAADRRREVASEVGNEMGAA